MVNTYFIADTHFNHGNIIKYCNRPFLMSEDKEALIQNGNCWHNGNWKGDKASNWRISQKAIELMDSTIIDNINDMVKEDDILWHLGDFAICHKRDYVQMCTEYRNRIKCKNVNIVWGNHDDPRSIRHLFKEAHCLTKISTRVAPIVLCHYALATWNDSHRGSFMLYGHSHTTAEFWLDNNMPGRRSMDVGVDNAYRLFNKFRPFAISDISTLLKNRKGFAMDQGIPTNSTSLREEDLV